MRKLLIVGLYLTVGTVLLLSTTACGGGSSSGGSESTGPAQWDGATWDGATWEE